MQAASVVDCTPSPRASAASPGRRCRPASRRSSRSRRLARPSVPSLPRPRPAQSLGSSMSRSTGTRISSSRAPLSSMRVNCCVFGRRRSSDGSRPVRRCTSFAAISLKPGFLRHRTSRRICVAAAAPRARARAADAGQGVVPDPLRASRIGPRQPASQQLQALRCLPPRPLRISPHQRPSALFREGAGRRDPQGCSERETATTDQDLAIRS